jgi:hypothetical protein
MRDHRKAAKNSDGLKVLMANGDYRSRLDPTDMAIIEIMQVAASAFQNSAAASACRNPRRRSG